jgi:hypothetical protein
MHIFICTYGRVNTQTTWDNLPESVRKNTKIVIQAREAYAWGKTSEIESNLVLPDYVRDIAGTRKYLCETYGTKICMLDDDLTFAMRRLDQPDKFAPATATEIEGMFVDIENRLNQFTHVGVSGREGANRRTESYLQVGRMMRILAYNTKIKNDVGIQFGRIPLMEDFDVTLQLLRAGHPNLILNWIVHDQKGSNSEGGCSAYRTDQMQFLAASTLAELHPDFVTVVRKTTKAAWGGGTRYDVRVQWKKAYDSSRALSILDTGEGEDTTEEGAGTP